jgi:hypothetical protein
MPTPGARPRRRALTPPVPVPRRSRRAARASRAPDRPVRRTGAAPRTPRLAPRPDRAIAHRRSDTSAAVLPPPPPGDSAPQGRSGIDPVDRSSTVRTPPATRPAAGPASSPSGRAAVRSTDADRRMPTPFPTRHRRHAPPDSPRPVRPGSPTTTSCRPQDPRAAPICRCVRLAPRPATRRVDRIRSSFPTTSLSRASPRNTAT